MTESSVREQAVLDLLRDQYESQGAAFFAYPARSLVPSFLDDYRPDAIVKKADGRWIAVEVKHSISSTADRRLAEVASKFGEHSDWSFLIVQPDQFPQLRQQFAVGSTASISAAIQEMDFLAESGHLRAAFLTGWSVLEALARVRLGSALKNPNQSFGPTTLAETLEQYGLVSAEDGRALRSLAPLRNSVVHGDLDYNVSSQAVDRLRTIVGSLEEAEPVGGN